MNQHFNAILTSLTLTLILVLVYAVSGYGSINYEELEYQNSFSNYHSSKLPELNYYKDYESLRAPANAAVVYPIFTQSAYQWGGIHDFYTDRCDTCLSVTISPAYEKLFSASGNGYRILEFLGYEVIDDIDIDKNPSILERYDKIVLLHNEFVTKKEFEAITNHPHVIYLYPHALTSQVEVDYNTNTISLIRGPGFPNEDIVNGFQWEYDNSQYFDDWSCKEWKFYKIDNGFMLNCFPETELPNYGHGILKYVKIL